LPCAVNRGVLQRRFVSAGLPSWSGVRLSCIVVLCAEPTRQSISIAKKRSNGYCTGRLRRDSGQRGPRRILLGHPAVRGHLRCRPAPSPVRLLLVRVRSRPVFRFHPLPPDFGPLTVSSNG
jgi:hypothetical protein